MQSKAIPATIMAAIITGILGCLGVVLAATIGLGLPFVERYVDTETSTPVVIVVTPTAFVHQQNPTPTGKMPQPVQSTETPVVPVVGPSKITPKLQVGPYWGWRNELNAETLMFNILAEDNCVDSIEVVIDGRAFTANVIDNPNDSHYQEKIVPFEGATGYSCNYIIAGGVVRPTKSFSVPAATYGVDLPPSQPFEWCYQSVDKTWYPCN